MGLALILTSSNMESSKREDSLIKIISRRWTESQWELYLKQFDYTEPEEEMYVGTTKDLEDYVTKKSAVGFTPTSNIEEIIEFKRSIKGSEK